MIAYDYAIAAIEEVKEIVMQTNADDIQKLIEDINSASRVFVAGAGRSLLMLRAFAMRLMHLGLNSYVVGETTTPAINKEDLLLVASASGETATVQVVSEKAKKAGAKLAVITIHAQSTLAQKADRLLVIPGSTDKVPSEFRSIQPAGSSFEQSLLLVLEGMVMCIAKEKKFDSSNGFSRHANLE